MMIYVRKGQKVHDIGQNLYILKASWTENQVPPQPYFFLYLNDI